MKTLKSYKATLDTGAGGETTIEAQDISQAKRLAVKWAEAGDWTSTESHIIRIYDADTDEFLGEERVTIEANTQEPD